MTQYNLNQGLKLHGKQGEEAMQKELQQLHYMETFEPVDLKMLTYEGRKKVIASLMFLTEKHDGSIKAGACADGQKQWNYTDKIDTALPMVMTESIFTTPTRDANKSHNVAIFDLMGVFLHAKNDKMIFMLNWLN